jgi:hypothetical protein
VQHPLRRRAPVFERTPIRQSKQEKLPRQAKKEQNYERSLIFAVTFTYLFVKVGAALGGGRMAGVKLGLLVAVLSPVIGSLYQYFGVTYMSVGLMAAESVFQMIAHAIEGAVAGAMYKAEVAPKTVAATAR